MTHNLIIDDFNAKLGYGQRNEKGAIFLGFLMRNGLFAMNSFSKRALKRNGRGDKNEIDFILQTIKIWSRMLRSLTTTRWEPTKDESELKS